MLSEYLWRGEVDEVPVVGLREVSEVEAHYLFALLFVAAVFFNEGEQCTHPVFVPGGMEKEGNGVERFVDVLSADRSYDRDCYAEKFVALSIFAFSGFGKSGEDFCFLLRGMEAELILPFFYHFTKLRFLAVGEGSAEG